MHEDSKTLTGNRALQISESLIFESSNEGSSGVDFSDIWMEDDNFTSPYTPPQSHLKKEKLGLPELSEPSVLRHFVRLSQKNYSIDCGIYPLGSCTMKHNPRLNEKMANLDGFSSIHPLQPSQTAQGALMVMHNLARWLLLLTNMSAVTLLPKAGAHGELCGMMAIKAALKSRNEHEERQYVLIPKSAHGTNPATASMLGFKVETIGILEDTCVDTCALKKRLNKNKNVAAVMLTNPNTCGIFEKDINDIADAVHQAGAFLYCDGANFNGLMGKIRPGDFGIDAMHINLHKTFSTPHGGGGPGSGPVVFSEDLAPFVPIPYIVQQKDGTMKLSEENSDNTIGRLVAFQGQMGIFVRALTYILSHGEDGLRQACEDAVLSANYVLYSLKDTLAPFSCKKFCVHEALFDDSCLNNSGVSTVDLAKALIDEGFHPMTIYFPLVAHGAILIEPTESESKQSLDQFIDVLKRLVILTRDKRNKDKFLNAPIYAPIKRLDETMAARNPVLTWQDMRQ